jgi:hypothetical protein
MIGARIDTVRATYIEYRTNHEWLLGFPMALRSNHQLSFLDGPEVEANSSSIFAPIASMVLKSASICT